MKRAPSRDAEIASTNFLRGKNMLRQGNYKGALDMLRRAHEACPEDRDIRLHYLYAEYLDIPKDGEGAPLEGERAREIYRELVEAEKEMEDVDWIKVFVGVVALGLGKERRAAYMFRLALMENPQNPEAKRYERLLELRKKREANKGLLDRLMDRFRGR